MRPGMLPLLQRPRRSQYTPTFVNALTKYKPLAQKITKVFTLLLSYEFHFLFEF